jgi:hypothetical protein
LLLVGLSLPDPVVQGTLGEIHFSGDLANRFIGRKDDANGLGFLLIGEEATFFG